MAKFELENTVIGGGILGTWITYELSKHAPGQTVLIEKNAYLGDETTGRNSGVLHAGLYYPRGSLKHKACLAGNRLWQEFCQKFDLPYKNCGKFVVASVETDRDRLAQVLENARLNGVPGIRNALDNELEELREFVHASAAIFSPSTGILDVPEMIKFLAKEIFNRDVPILLENSCLNLKALPGGGVQVETERESFTSKRVFNCAGNHAIGLRKLLGLKDLSPHYVRGNYLKYKRQQDFPGEELIYPIPPLDGISLGVHLTKNFAGEVYFGPNEEVIDSYDCQVNPLCETAMAKDVDKLFKRVELSELYADYAGVRPKVKKLATGEVVKDFVVNDPKSTNISGYYELLGIDSPGLTAAPALAKYALTLLGIER